MPLTLNRATLRDVLLATGQSSPEPVTNPIGEEVAQFIHLSRQDGDYYIHFSNSLITGTNLGRILLQPGETVEFVPWTKTDLLRGNRENPSLAVPPAPAYTSDLTAIFDWFVALPFALERRNDLMDKFKSTDRTLTLERAKLLWELRGKGLPEPENEANVPAWTADFITKARERAIKERRQIAFLRDIELLDGLYRNRLAVSGPFPINVVVERDGVVQQSQVPLLVRKADSAEKPSGFVVIPPTLDDVLKKGIVNGKTIALTRMKDGRPQTYIFSLGYDNDGNSIDDVRRIDNIRDGLCLFDGDLVSISSIDDIPLVQASLLVSQHVIKPTLARQRDSKRLGLQVKEPRATLPGFAYLTDVLHNCRIKLGNIDTDIRYRPLAASQVDR